MHGAPSINLRARLTGDRQVALKTVLMLLQSASTVDLRDNRLVDDEALQRHAMRFREPRHRPTAVDEQLKCRLALYATAV